MEKRRREVKRPCLTVVAWVGLGEDDLAVDDGEAEVVGRAALDPEHVSHGW